MRCLNLVYLKGSLIRCELLLRMTWLHFVVLVALPGPPQLIAVAPRRSKISQLGPINAYFKPFYSVA